MPGCLKNLTGARLALHPIRKHEVDTGYDRLQLLITAHQIFQSMSYQNSPDLFSEICKTVGRNFDD